jgi:two-component system sensor histidine kinase MtrB
VTRSTGQTVPVMVVGSPVLIPGVGAYELYFLFPLDKEEDTLGLVRRALLLAAFGLVILVGGIAWLVTRQVVTPVRMAARIAERLSAGRLEERMRVRGEDDLARLAASFNRMATSLQRQIRQLEDLSRVQRRFVSDVSHELRTPLTTVRMAADVLHEARDGFDPAVQRSAEILQTQLDRFESLLADLLEISRYDAGAAVLDSEPTDLVAIARHVIESMEPLAEARGSELVLVIPRRPCVAEVDGRRIERILRNLVVNAIEHGEGRPVTVLVAGDDDAVAVAVRDRGVGLASPDVTMVFNRFWRADPARARTTGGTGLGLAIALEDAHLHGGWLQVWGDVGDGCQFRLTLPRRQGVELEGSPIPLEPRDSARRLRPLRVGEPYKRVGAAGNVDA